MKGFMNEELWGLPEEEEVGELPVSLLDGRAS